MMFQQQHAVHCAVKMHKSVLWVHKGSSSIKGRKKKCLGNVERKKKDEEKGKNLTLFSFLQHLDKREPTHAKVTREAERQKAASLSHIVVGPSVLPENNTLRDEQAVGKVWEEGGPLDNTP